MNIRNTLGRVIGVLAVAALVVGEAQAAAQAGRVAFAFGEVTIEGADGSQRSPRRGALVYSGDSITTGARGRVQLRFTDGSFMSLIPNTSFKIDEYRFEEESAEEDKGFFSLIKGGLRAITGLVGKRDRNDYQLKTAVATIGIRGSHYRTLLEQLGDAYRQLVSVGFDPKDPEAGINFTAAGVTVPVNPGQNAVVEGDDAQPRLTTETAELTAAPPTDTGTTDGEDTTGDVDQSTLLAGGSPSGVPAPSEVFGVLFGFEYVAAAVGPDADLLPSLASDIIPEDAGDIENSAFETYFTRGQAVTGAFSIDDIDNEVDFSFIDVAIAQGFLAVLSEFELSGVATNADFEAALNEFLSDPATNLDHGSSSTTGHAWGRWGGSNVLHITIADSGGNPVLTAFTQELSGHQSQHWITGPRALSFPSMGVGAYYFAAGEATRSTTLDGSGIGTGMTGGIVRVDYGHMVVQGDSLKVGHGGTITFNTSGSLVADTTAGGGGFLTSGSGTGGPCGSGCNAYLNGYLTNNGTGAVPNGAVGAYKLAPNFGDGDAGNTIHGVGGFKLDHYNPNGALDF